MKNYINKRVFLMLMIISNIVIALSSFSQLIDGTYEPGLYAVMMMFAIWGIYTTSKLIEDLYNSPKP